MAEKQNWALINKKNSIGPALGMAMGKAIDLTIASDEFKGIPMAENEKQADILAWRDWIYDQNNKKHQELLAELPKEGEENKPTEDYEF